jgi:NAD(P)-dependent dehydrogenase (short-subunit alcohol dehydrogenase family)
MAEIRFPMFELTGRTAIVTGAASGIGTACAEALAAAGANVVCSDIDEERLKRVVLSLKQSGSKAIGIRCDVSDEKSVASLVRDAECKSGPLEIIVNNAGVTDNEPRMGHDALTDDWNRVVSVNLNGVFFGCREALKVMMPRKRGRVVNIASMWGLTGAATVAPLPGYTATKGAVVNLTRELGLQYAPHGITINAVCPGHFHTRIGDGLYENPEMYDAMKSTIPMQRIADVEELKGTIIYLSSDASSFVTGSMLVIDGGTTAK